jgi:hypothetical protein
MLETVMAPAAPPTLCANVPATVFEWPLLAQKVISDWKWTVSAAAAQKMSWDDCFLLASMAAFVSFQGSHSVLARTPPPSSKKVLQSQALRDSVRTRPRFLLFVWKKEHLFAYTALELFACSLSAGKYERKI